MDTLFFHWKYTLYISRFVSGHRYIYTMIENEVNTWLTRHQSTHKFIFYVCLNLAISHKIYTWNTLESLKKLKLPRKKKFNDKRRTDLISFSICFEHFAFWKVAALYKKCNLFFKGVHFFQKNIFQKNVISNNVQHVGLALWGIIFILAHRATLLMLKNYVILKTYKFMLTIITLKTQWLCKILCFLVHINDKYEKYKILDEY